MISLKRKSLGLVLLMFLALFVFAGCSRYNDGYRDSNYIRVPNVNGEEYLEIEEEGFIKTSEDAVSTFSLDTSTAGYANLRRLINNDFSINENQVKIEEMVNYFTYDYASPTGDDALAISSEIMSCPWNPTHKLVSIGVKAKDIENNSQKLNNLVFLLDVSGSMNNPYKLPLMQSAFKMFVETLNDDDTISIVTYAGSNKIVLEGAKGSEKKRIVNVIEDLMAGGSTAGADGIKTAYALAQKYFIEGGNNRVILGTDGDFNVGISSVSGLKKFISEKRKTNVYLSVLGFGYGNLKDSNLATLASAGNGNYSYIDSITEARKVLVEEIGGTLNIVSKDTKTQVTFNPKHISEYRLLGYENKILTDEEFDDENTDAGEIGAGHVTTAVYEVVLNDDDSIFSTMDNNWMKVLIKYKDPETEANKEVTKYIDQTSEKDTPSEDIIFISAVIEFGLILRNSRYKGDASYNRIINRLEGLSSVENDPYRQEFLSLVIKRSDR